MIWEEERLLPPRQPHIGHASKTKTTKDRQQRFLSISLDIEWNSKHNPSTKKEKDKDEWYFEKAFYKDISFQVKQLSHYDALEAQCAHVST